jgi:formylglycine-generating enzyme required for sulfatase activity
MKRCEGGFAGLFDLSGNVSEWDDMCESGVGAGDLAAAGAGDACAIRGGSAYFSGEMDCAVVVGARRDTAFASIGFRCCADAE